MRQLKNVAAMMKNSAVSSLAWKAHCEKPRSTCLQNGAWLGSTSGKREIPASCMLSYPCFGLDVAAPSAVCGDLGLTFDEGGLATHSQHGRSVAGSVGDPIIAGGSPGWPRPC